MQSKKFMNSATKQPSFHLFNQYLLLLCAVDFRPSWSSGEASAGVHVSCRRLSRPGGCNLHWQRCRRLSGSILRRKSSFRGSVEPLGYHSSEDIDEPTSEICEDARLTAPETARTIIEVNNKAILWFPDVSDEEFEESAIWPELPYVTDNRGNIYFQVNNDKDFLQQLASENNMVQVVVGLDIMEMMYYMELPDINLGTDETEDEDSDEDEDEYDEEEDEDEYDEEEDEDEYDEEEDEDEYDEDEDEDEYDEDDEDEDDYNEDDEDDDDDEEEDEYQDWVSILEHLEDDAGEAPSDWAKLETMRKTHPLFFARRLTEAVSDDPEDLMEQLPSGLAIQGLLRPALIEEHSVIKRHIADLQSSKVDKDKIEKLVEDKVEDFGVINDHEDEPGSSGISPEERENNDISMNGSSFYKLEMIKILLLSAYGHPAVVEIDDFARAQPDAIAQSVAKIISSLNAGGEKTVQALKSLCWRCKGIQVEEATIAGLDSRGFDLRVCSGTRIQTLRFSFRKRATSEESAKRQIDDVLFPRSDHKPQKKRESDENEC